MDSLTVMWLKIFRMASFIIFPEKMEAKNLALCHHILTFFLSVKLQSKQVKRTPQNSINELIIWKMNSLVVPVTDVKFKAAFLHA